MSLVNEYKQRYSKLTMNEHDIKFVKTMEMLRAKYNEINTHRHKTRLIEAPNSVFPSKNTEKIEKTTNTEKIEKTTNTEKIEKSERKHRVQNTQPVRVCKAIKMDGLPCNAKLKIDWVGCLCKRHSKKTL